jgi:hypothetical protein
MLARKRERAEFFRKFDAEIAQVPDVKEIVGCLAPLMRSAFFEEARAAAVALCAQRNSPELLRYAIDCVRESASAASTDFLRVVVGNSQTRDLGPCMHEIVERLTTLVQSESAINRKSAVFCFAEMRRVIGKRFEPEIGKLPPVLRKMVQYYYEQFEVQARAGTDDSG